MRRRPESCEGCALHGRGTDFSQPEGTGSLGVLVLGEASGEMEARDQLPFRPFAPAGAILDRTLRRMSIARPQMAISNVCRCRPPNNFLEKAPWEFASLNHCRPNLRKVIDTYRPRCILTLGGIALREVTGEAGESRGVSHLMGYVLPSSPDLGGVPCVPALHPAFIRRGKACMQGVFARNLQRAVQVAAGRDREWLWGIDPAQKETYGSLRYSLHPGLDEARCFRDRVMANGGSIVSYDIETYESASLDEDARDGFTDTRIRLIQFSLDSCSGIAFPWEGQYRDIAVEILRSPNTKCGHNLWLFDNKVLDACALREGLDLRVNGPVHDTLQMFHHWQPDLPAHLQFAAQFVSFPFPWKHLAATDLEFYSCVDVDATLRLYTFLRTALERDGLWDSAGGVGGYVGQVAEVRPILAAMERRGLPVDDRERLKLDGEFDLAQQELDSELQRRVPEEVLGLEPRRGKKGNCDYGYLKTPKDTDGLVLRTFTVASVDESTGEPCRISVERYCRQVPFNANSGPQLLRYMDAKGHKRPKSREQDDDGNDKDTTGKEDLVRLAHRTGDDFYLRVIEYRELSKMRGTYIEGFKPHANGRVHTTFTFDTGIGQLSSRNPNIQNFPKRGRLAKAIRRMVAAKPGHLLVDWDYKSCHVLTLGYLAGDATYMRFARIDQHSIMTGHFLKLWRAQDLVRESDTEIKARCKWLKSNEAYKEIRDKKVKHAGLGIGNGLKAKGLYERYMEFFKNQKEAQAILADYEEVFPKVFEWQRHIQQQAHEQQFLRTEYGHIRRFYEVFRWDYRKQCYSHGDQAEEAISYWLSNIAFGYIREHLRLLADLGLDEKYGMFDNVHDALSFHIRAEQLEEHIAEVYPVLITPSKVLHGPAAPNGLWIDAECNAGPNWSDMKEVPHASSSTNALLAG